MLLAQARWMQVGRIKPATTEDVWTPVLRERLHRVVDVLQATAMESDGNIAAIRVGDLRAMIALLLALAPDEKPRRRRAQGKAG